MPYKNPEHKRQWEREHRDERNARRRKAASSVRVVPILRTKGSQPAHDPNNASQIVARLRTRRVEAPAPALEEQAGDGWVVIIAFAAVVVLLLLASLNGSVPPDQGAAGPGPISPPQPPSSGM